MYRTKVKSQAKQIKIKQKKQMDKSELKFSKKIANQFSSQKFVQNTIGKRQKRCFSNIQAKSIIRNNSLKNSTVSSIKKQKRETFFYKNKEEDKIKKNSTDRHFLTVAELQSAQKSLKQQLEFSQIKNNIRHMASKIISLKISPNKQSRQQFEGYLQKHKIPLSQQLQAQLDNTIDKLKSKQNTITILNKTIQTKLVQSTQSLQKQNKYTNRLDAYQVQINFYIDKISQLQKELYEKNKLVKTLANKTIYFDTLVKNNKKIIDENNRLKQEKQILDKQNFILKKIVNKKYQKGV